MYEDVARANDERLNQYLSNPITSHQRAQGEKQAEELTSITGLNYKQLRILAKNDVFFLGNAILGYNKLSKNLHGHVAAWMMRNRKARFRELLLPRGHYKSTIWTITDSIRLGLPDDAGLDIWPECLGTNVRVMIAHEAKEKAATFLVSIAGHFLSNPLLLALFPECLPVIKKQRVNKFELELPRTEIFNEATYTCMGVGGKSQGYHFNTLKLDDLIGQEARDSNAEMENAISWIDNIQSFFIEFTRDHLDITGTRWAPRDLYHHLHVTYGPALLKYIRPAEEPVLDSEGKKTGKYAPIFPEGFTTESFALIKQNPIVWAAQYANNPEAVAREFLDSWKRYYKWLKYGDKLVAYRGQSDTVELNKVVTVKDMDRCIFVDPAMTGLMGITITGSTVNDIYILEAIKGQIRPPDFVDLLFTLVLKWNPRVVAIEEVLFSGLYKPWLEREMQARRTFFSILPVKVGNKAKEARLRGLANYFAGGRIHFPALGYKLTGEVNSLAPALEEEYDGFGSSGDVKNVHMLDSLSMGPEVWLSRPMTQTDWSQYREYEQEIVNQRDSMTGY